MIRGRRRWGRRWRWGWQRRWQDNKLALDLVDCIAIKEGGIVFFPGKIYSKGGLGKKLLFVLE